MSEDEYNERRARYDAHMERFKAAHAGHPHGGLLIGLEAQERWTKIMGPDLDFMAPPALEAAIKGG